MIARGHDCRAIVLIARAAALIIAVLSLPARALGAPAEPYFLVATHDLHDPMFSESVILMLPISEDGLIVGVIINKRTNIRVRDLISGAAALPKPAETAFFGGPVEVNTPVIVIRATRPVASAIHLFEDVYLVTASAQITGYVKAPTVGSSARIIVGRAQWMPDQLKAELAAGSWYEAPADADTIFSAEPEKVWEELVKRGELQEADAGGGNAFDILDLAGSCLVWEGPQRLFFD